MAELRFLADMNISPETVRDLRKLGWKIARVSELMDIRASDRDILSYAQERTLIIVTQDLDFSALLAVGGHAVPSVIILRLADARPGLVTQRVRDAVAWMGRELEEGAVISVDEASVRCRSLPIKTD